MKTRASLVVFFAAALAGGVWVAHHATAQDGAVDAVAEPARVAAVDATDNATLGRWIEAATEGPAQGGGGRWQFVVAGRPLLVLTDEGADRMWLMTPVGRGLELDQPLMEILMRANFDRALDARYAVNGDVLWSVYIHPLSPLRESQFGSAVSQVVALAENFGTTYASSDMVFGDAFDPEGRDDAPPPVDADRIL
ncbi:MAG: type III secretion system chaperone [Planctomycetota bacterium]